MALPYKIPKKQHRDQCNVFMQSPLSRLQDSSERYGSGSAQKISHTSEEMPSENSHSSGNVRLFKPRGEKPGWDNVQRRGSHEKFSFKMNRQPIKVSPIRVNGTPGKTFMSRPQNPLADRASVDVRWRPKRASDKLCQDENHQADQRSPYFKILRGGDPSQAETNGFFHEAEEKQEISKPPRSSTAETTSRLLRTDVVFPHAISDDLTNPEEGENQQKNITALKKDARLVSSNHQTRLHSDSTPESKRKDLLETFNRNRWIFCKSYKRRKPVSTEPIVLSSDDEGADVMNDASGGSVSEISQIRSQEGPKTTSEKSVPSYIELEFSSFHYDTEETQANGTIMITDDGILIPLKGSREEDQITVSVTCSQLLGYGLWDGVSALLFLMVSDAQATLLQKELSPLHNTHSPDQACPFVLLVLAQRLDDLKAALLASLMDAIGLRHSIDGLRNALSITEGLSTFRSHPCGGHLLRLLGQNQAVEASGKNSAGGIDTISTVTEGNVRRALRSHSGQQSLTRRLIQYPPPPSKGGITVSTEDLDCLKDGEFLNDVIIDFYLKYLLLERADRKMAEKSHIFSSFFYKQLTRKDASNPEEAGTKARYRRHQRVKTWTRHVDIFSKDYIFIPVNHEAHWYLVVICFPGLEQPEVQQNPGKRLTGTSLNSTGNRNVTVHKSDNMPICTELHCTRDTVCRRPCILVMDSLKLSSHNRIYTLLREYLEVEWCVRKERARVFSTESLSGSVCRVPLQDNSSDCGLYLLQYVESFLQNPVVHFDLPLRLEHWFPRQQVRRKREELRALVLQLYRIQGGGAN